MKFKLHCALGTWGITLGTTYRDFCFDRKDCTLHMFVNNGSSKSWYLFIWRGLLRPGWYLLRREDMWGIFRGAVKDKWKAKRTPPLYSREQTGVHNTADRAWELREQFKPYMVLDWYGQRKEVISYPVPNSNSVSVMLRDVGDPTTLEEVVLEQYM